MEFDGAWSLDSTASGFEKMEAGLIARAIDFAKPGRLSLNRGDWDGKQPISAEWLDLATGVDPRGLPPAFSDVTPYGLMWWVRPRAAGAPDYSAIGDHGQFVFVSPRNRVIIVRTGTPSRPIECGHLRYAGRESLPRGRLSTDVGGPQRLGRPWRGAQTRCTLRPLGLDSRWSPPPSASTRN